MVSRLLFALLCFALLRCDYVVAMLFGQTQEGRGSHEPWAMARRDRTRTSISRLFERLNETPRYDTAAVAVTAIPSKLALVALARSVRRGFSE